MPVLVLVLVTGPGTFFLQYLYRYETAVPGGFFKKKVYKLHTGTRYKGTEVLAYRYRLPTIQKNPGIRIQVLSRMHTILYVKTFEDAGSGQK